MSSRRSLDIELSRQRPGSAHIPGAAAQGELDVQLSDPDVGRQPDQAPEGLVDEDQRVPPGPGVVQGPGRKLRVDRGRAHGQQRRLLRRYEGFDDGRC